MPLPGGWSDRREKGADVGGEGAQRTVARREAEEIGGGAVEVGFAAGAAVENQAREMCAQKIRVRAGECFDGCEQRGGGRIVRGAREEFFARGHLGLGVVVHRGDALDEGGPCGGFLGVDPRAEAGEFAFGERELAAALGVVEIETEAGEHETALRRGEVSGVGNGGGSAALVQRGEFGGGEAAGDEPGEEETLVGWSVIGGGAGRGGEFRLRGSEACEGRGGETGEIGLGAGRESGERGEGEGEAQRTERVHSL